MLMYVDSGKVLALHWTLLVDINRVHRTSLVVYGRLIRLWRDSVDV